MICVFTAPVQAREFQDKNIAVMRSLDKVSARSSTFEIPVGKTVKFGGTLFIRVQACRKSPPIDPPESAAFVEIWENIIDRDKAEWIFSGWMFASSPALSAMDHPVYDVWVIDCKKASTTDKSEDAFTSEAAPDVAIESSLEN